MNAAANTMIASAGVLTSQLTQLEVRCSGELMVRSRPGHARQHLTELGRRLLEQADEHLGANPDAPPELPEPLASALSGFWERTRLNEFIVAARHDSLAIAAEALGINRYDLNDRIRGLEEVVGGVLLDRTSPSRPHHLSALGRLLLTQAESCRNDSAR